MPQQRVPKRPREVVQYRVVSSVVELNQFLRDGWHFSQTLSSERDWDTHQDARGWWYTDRFLVWTTEVV